MTTDKFIAINLYLCPFDKHPHMDCITRKCKCCGVKLVEKLIEHLDQKKEVSWYKWMAVVNDNKKRKIVLVTIKGSLKQLLELYMEQMHDMARHLFVASWQCKQLQLAIKQIDEGKVVQVLDFAQNKLLIFQDEPQSVHWDHNQCTIHPIVNYYQCETCAKAVVKEDVVIVSDDLKHDSFAVQVFEQKVHDHLTQTRNLAIVQMHQFTDGASAQYKCIKSFTHIAESHKKYGYSISRHYFGSGHGKGPSDGATASFKRLLNSAVKARKAQLTNVEDVYKYAKANLEIKAIEAGQCTHYRRHVIMVAKKEIKMILETKPGVPQTRQIHSVCNIQESGLLKTRNLSCFCEPCMGLEAGTRCRNGDHVAHWKTIELERPKRNCHFKPKNKIVKKSLKKTDANLLNPSHT